MSKPSTTTATERSVHLTSVLSQVRGVAFNQLQRVELDGDDRAQGAVDLVEAWDQCAGSLARTGSAVEDKRRQGALLQLAAVAVRILVAMKAAPQPVDQKAEQPNTDLFNEQA